MVRFGPSFRRRIRRPPPLKGRWRLRAVWGRWLKRLGLDRREVRRRVLLIAGAVAAAALAALAAWHLVAARRVVDYRKLAERYGRASGLDPDLVLAVIRAESAGDPKAVSRAGARGLMQLMPRTAEEVARSAGIRLRGADELFQPDLNVRLGTLYLAQLRRGFGDDPYLYVAAYNAGPGNVDRWRLQNPGLSSAELIERVAFQETRHYVKAVLRTWRAAKRT